MWELITAVEAGGSVGIVPSFIPVMMPVLFLIQAAEAINNATIILLIELL